ncbi:MULTISPECIES: cytochrome b [Halomonas]|uniref:cytochrome b n=1 Tax=Halomonas TaxID=2745 RepID=UPI001C969308|nr:MULTISPECIES: cytochrome b/b6 domain-containing protein [Halomonas]MBY6208156.1 cytochrome b/b6 domain-containing protein [Halomonas sp. DP3Y7-2]MBY6228965.1 cytochrome b/b6 domain-containing protein [Halomonas sp. DP3Y7-1]MCA0917051.1 cytochrome b/b6 domain-containing protein [Halomonas denitrificans]
MSIIDSPERYGSISRFFHWSIAALVLWQLVTAITTVLFEDSWLDKLTWATHKPVGLLILILMLGRVAWALLNQRRRPSSLNLPSHLGHLALYALLVVIPSMALMRQYGSGRAFSPFGIELMSGFDGDKIEWMMLPANLLHGWLGWALFAMALGHVLMAVHHRMNPRQQDVLPRMLDVSARK